MNDIRKTVFISYRRQTSEEMANWIYWELKAKGYRVFLDQKSLESGLFPKQLQDFIDTSGNFIIVVDEQTFVRCSSKKDWVRMEIERAMRLLPNICIVPFFVGDFSFNTQRVKNDLQVAGNRVRKLRDFEGVKYEIGQMHGAIEKLCYYFSRSSINVEARKPIEISEPEPPPQPTNDIKLAQDYILMAREKANAGELKDAVNLYSRAIELAPTNMHLYGVRGDLYSKLGLSYLAFDDYLHGLYRNHYDPYVYYRIGVINYDNGNFVAAQKDFSIASLLNPEFGEPYYYLANIMRKGHSLLVGLRGNEETVLDELNQALDYYNKFLRFGVGIEDERHEVEAQIEKIHEDIMYIHSGHDPFYIRSDKFSDWDEIENNGEYIEDDTDDNPEDD